MNEGKIDVNDQVLLMHYYSWYVDRCFKLLQVKEKIERS